MPPLLALALRKGKDGVVEHARKTTTLHRQIQRVLTYFHLLLLPLGLCRGHFRLGGCLGKIPLGLGQEFICLAAVHRHPVPLPRLLPESHRPGSRIGNIQQARLRPRRLQPRPSFRNALRRTPVPARGRIVWRAILVAAGCAVVDEPDAGRSCSRRRRTAALCTQWCKPIPPCPTR